MRPRKLPHRRQAPWRKPEPRSEPPPPPAETLALKTSGVTLADTIRVLAVPGSGIFRDGMTVGDFLRGVPNRAVGMHMLARCQRAGTIGFQHRDPEPGAAP